MQFSESQLLHGCKLEKKRNTKTGLHKEGLEA